MPKVYENAIQIKLHRGFDEDEYLYMHALEKQLPPLREMFATTEES